MAEYHWLRHLEMREPGHQGIDVLLGQIQQRSLHRMDQTDNIVNRMSQIKPYIGRNLIVARPRSVQALPGIPDQRGKAFLYIEMHIFQFDPPDEIAIMNFSRT